MDEKTLKTLTSSKGKDWETPDELFQICKEIFDIRYDIAANVKNTKCDMYIDEQDDALSEWSWKSRLAFKYKQLTSYMEGTMWLNPPYGHGMINWIKRAIHETSTAGSHMPLVMLLPARTDTKWFELLATHALRIYFLKGRLHFKFGDGPNAGKYPAPFPSLISYMNGKNKFKYEDIKLLNLCTLVY